MRTAAITPSFAHRARLLLAAYLVIPTALVLGPLPVRLLDRTTVAAQDLAERLGASRDAVSRMDVEAACNVLLFAPLGFLLARAFPRIGLLRLWLGCVAASVAIEVLQGVFLSGRHATVADVLLNASGAALGLAGAHALGRREAS